MVFKPKTLCNHVSTDDSFDKDELDSEGSFLSSDVSTQPKFGSIEEQEKVAIMNRFVILSKSTLKKNLQCMKTFKKWIESQPNPEEGNIWEIPPDKLDPLIGSFLLSVRKGDGSEYEPDTLTTYHRGIER